MFWLTLRDQIDHHIHIAVNEAHQIIENYRSVERDALIKNLVSAQGMTVVVLSPDGAPILETNSPDVAIVTEHQLQKILTFSSLYESAPVHFTENNIRFAAMPVQVSAGKGIVAVGYSTKVLYATFYKMLGIVAAAIFLLVIPITLLGIRLLKKQLYPLESIATQTSAINSLSSLTTRINIAPATTEIMIIQKSFNLMLARLEQVFKAEQEFFSNTAHTLKTPLAILQSQVENSQLSLNTKDKLLSTIKDASETIQDLLLMAKIGNEPLSAQSLSLTDLMNNLTELATTLGENKHLKVSSNIQPNIMINANPNLLQRALSNVVHNAVTYNRVNGTVAVSLRKESNKIVIVVEDTGHGIKPSELPNVASRFFRGSNAASSGSGLGLAISKTVIENLAGEMLITSSLNHGTTVTIKLPI